MPLERTRHFTHWVKLNQVNYFHIQGAIVIHEVYEDGAAAKDGRLWAGDQILEVSMP